jgi:hypothetical protein
MSITPLTELANDLGVFNEVETAFDFNLFFGISIDLN